MKKIKIDGKEYEVEDAVATAIAATGKRQDALQEKIDALTKEMEASKKKTEKKGDGEDKFQKLQDQLDATRDELKKVQETKSDSSGKAVQVAVRERMRLEDTASKVLGQDKFREVRDQDDFELKKTLIIKDSGDEKLDLSKKSESYVDARYDLIAEGITRSKDAHQRLGHSVAAGAVGNVEDSEMSESEKKRRDSMKADTEAYTQPIGITKANAATAKTA